MALFSKPRPTKSYLPPDVDPEELLRDYQADIDALVNAVLSGQTDVEFILAELVENESELVRIAIVEKIRQMVREQSEEKAKALDQVMQQQKLLEHHRQKRVMQEWLAYFMSEETLRKLRESFLANPKLQRDVEHAGQELAKKGVLQNLQPQNRSDLGELSANVNQGRDAGKGKEQGR